MARPGRAAPEAIGTAQPRRRAAVNGAREVIADGHRRKSQLGARTSRPARRGAWFKREIGPKLDAFSLKRIAESTGLSLAACSRFRAGSQMPHPRHWEGLLALVEAGK